MLFKRWHGTDWAPNQATLNLYLCVWFINYTVSFLVLSDIIKPNTLLAFSHCYFSSKFCTPLRMFSPLTFIVCFLY